ncbi:hypothetical protein SK128_018216 [Halocaridina rubra]|uniref:Uncharacterized protein n=1 Tax=Halocaridina rubra TaxID=373956 RepID=A0AAN8WKE7_HALRR
MSAMALALVTAVMIIALGTFSETSREPRYIYINPEADMSVGALGVFPFYLALPTIVDIPKHLPGGQIVEEEEIPEGEGDIEIEDGDVVEVIELEEGEEIPEGLEVVGIEEVEIEEGEELPEGVEIVEVAEEEVPEGVEIVEVAEGEEVPEGEIIEVVEEVVEGDSAPAGEEVVEVVEEKASNAKRRFLRSATSRKAPEGKDAVEEKEAPKAKRRILRRITRKVKEYPDVLYWEPAYEPQLDRLTTYFNYLKLVKLPCQERLLCELSSEAENFPLFSEIFLKELRLSNGPVKTTKDSLIWRYMSAANKGSTGLTEECATDYPKCKRGANRILNIPVLKLWQYIASVVNLQLV